MFEKSKEVRGWLWYNFSMEGISASAVSIFLPLLLNSQIFKSGFDVETRADCQIERIEYCVISVGNILVTPTAFSFYVIAVSVLLQAIGFISIGSFADYGLLRKKLLILSTFLGSLSTISILFAFHPGAYWTVSVLICLISLFLGISSVFYNSYLPLFARDEASDDLERERITNMLSAKGFVYGYSAGVIQLIISAVILNLHPKDSATAVPICIALSGFWWLLFSVYPLSSLKSRPGMEFPSVFNTLSKCKQLSITFWFLAAYFVYSDGVSTLASVAVLFAREELEMSDQEIIILAIIVPFCALIGNLFFVQVQHFFNWRTKNVLVFQLVVMSFVPAYALLGLFNSTFGLRQKWEIYTTTCIFGFFMGAIHSYSRACFSELVPHGEESEFFSLYAITDKGSAWIGPMLVAAVTNTTRQIRSGMFVILIMILLPLPILLKVDTRKGRIAASEYSRLED